jgi:hypothetical protein
MSGFAELDVHPDVPDGRRAPTATGLRVTARTPRPAPGLSACDGGARHLAGPDCE